MSSFGVGETLCNERYRLDEILGRGGMAIVWKARDLQLERDVAIALVKTEGLDDAARERVRAEARAMARLGDHPAIVTVHDIGDEAGEPYIVSQYMAGGALQDLLDQAPDRRLDLETGLRVAEGVCSALEHAHSAGIVHRDIKPANVWLTADGTPKLGDFGLAFSLQQARVTKAGAIVGVENPEPTSVIDQLEQCGVIAAIGRTPAFPSHAERAWWLSPGYEVHAVAELDGTSFAIDAEVEPSFARWS